MSALLPARRLLTHTDLLCVRLFAQQSLPSASATFSLLNGRFVRLRKVCVCVCVCVCVEEEEEEGVANRRTLLFFYFFPSSYSLLSPGTCCLT